MMHNIAQMKMDAWDDVPDDWLGRKLSTDAENWEGLSIEPVRLGLDRTEHPLSQFGVRVKIAKEGGQFIETVINLATISDMINCMGKWADFDCNSPIKSTFGSMIGA